MTEDVKQPLIIEKISMIDEKIERLAKVLSPITNHSEKEKSVEIPYKSQSIVLEQLDRLNQKLDLLISIIDID
jgi:hypothetical protein